MNPRIVRLLPGLFLVSVVLIFFLPLAGDQILARGDTFVYFYPYWHVRDAALSSGDLPLWSPDIFMGAPLLANPQVGTLYPPNWLTVNLSAPDAITVSIVLHVLWAALGVYLLARRQNLTQWAAIAAALIFALGGHLGAHIEQINQLQGLAWLPWLFWAFSLTVAHPKRGFLLMALAWAMQILSGHTQTVFIAGVGLGVYALFWAASTPPEGNRPRWQTMLRVLLLIGGAALLAVIFALPQLIPTQELISLSNRGGGLTRQQATAFSLNPLLAGRSLLPSYAGQPFTEYLGYAGIIGFGLAVVGAFSDQWHGQRQRWPWIGLAALGLLFALGRHNPLYWALAGLPGFNLFRVPARWLALFALGMTLLAGMGVQALQKGLSKRTTTRTVGVIITISIFLMGLSLLADRAADEINGPALPDALTWALWITALLVTVAVILLRQQRLKTKQARWLTAGIVLALTLELFAAAQNLPYNDLSDPAVLEEARFPAYQMQVYGETTTPPGRLLSISDLRFDPGDKATLEARWQAMDLSDRGAEYAFTATKLQEILAPNTGLLWDVPSIDGFGGGVLPTMYYTAFTSLMLPEGTLRTVDGRLREVLALSDCRGACISDDRWLDLTNTRYILTDKVFDVVHEGVFYDTQWIFPLDADDGLTLDDLHDFEADSVHVLYACDDCESPQIDLDGEDLAVTATIPGVQEFTLAQYALPQATTPESITITARAAATATIRAVSLVDDRTGDFVPLAPPGWRRVFSGDVKIYENLDVLPRAFVVHNAQTVPDSWDGTETALDLMRDPAFDPAETVILHGAADDITAEDDSSATTTISTYATTEVIINVESNTPGYLLLTDAYYPGWQASINGEAVPIIRADVMFRVVKIPAGISKVTFTYHPDWLFWD